MGEDDEKPCRCETSQLWESCRNSGQRAWSSRNRTAGAGELPNPQALMTHPREGFFQCVLSVSGLLEEHMAYWLTLLVYWHVNHTLLQTLLPDVDMMLSLLLLINIDYWPSVSIVCVWLSGPGTKSLEAKQWTKCLLLFSLRSPRILYANKTDRALLIPMCISTKYSTMTDLSYGCGSENALGPMDCSSAKDHCYAAGGQWAGGVRITALQVQ